MNTKPTEELMKEHSAIQLMLEILSEACTRLESGGKVVVTDLKKMLEFLKEFADGCHHAKEERHLFPALERAGIPRERGPIGVMLAEHNLGRSHIRRMSSAISGLAAGDTRAKESIS
jgi:hemerythrin-like domain-containing protein